MKPRFLPPEPTEREIQQAAFLLWERQGRPAGHDLEIWLAAKERLALALARPVVVAPRPGKTVRRRRAAWAMPAGGH